MDNDNDGGMGIGKLFSDPNLLAKLAGNPRTSKYLADPSFAQMVCGHPKIATDSFTHGRLLL